MKKKDVTLIGEEHTDSSHMEHVTFLVKDKLTTYSNVVVALEQDCGTKIFNDLNTEKQTPTNVRTSKRLKDLKDNKPPETLESKIENFTGLGNMNFDNELMRATYK